MSSETFDTIIIGSGAGGAAAAYHLTLAGQRVLLLEKGPRLERSPRTLDPELVVQQGHFKSAEAWQDGQGRRIVPEEYFNLGGKTKWYGAALLRFADHEMLGDAAFDCSPWPVSAHEFAPYYAQAERLLGVRQFPCEADLARIIAGLSRRPGWNAQPLPMGLAAEIADDAQEASHFDGFASARGLKADAEVALLDRLRDRPNLTIATGQTVVDLIAANGDARCVQGVRVADGTVYRADHVLLAAGALHSPRLLAHYLDTNGLANLPARAQVGRNLKLHLLTAMLALSTSRKHDRLRKTMVLLNDTLPHSSVQPLGFDSDLLASLVPKPVPRVLARLIGTHAYGFFLQTEDGSHPDNRVASATDGTPILDYDPRRSPVALREHERLIHCLRRDLLRAGHVSFVQRIGVTGTAHACGTLRAGDDASSSVVDAEGRVHGLRGLWVVDGSVLPRSSRVNPSLSIFAWALRVAARLLEQRRLAA